MKDAWVRITDGPFCGLEGWILKPPSRRRPNATIAVRFVKQTVRIVIPPTAIEVLAPSSVPVARDLAVCVAPLNNELIRHLAAHPNDLYTVNPRRFEELIAELLRDMGHDVHLTPPTRDGGRDVLALFRTPAFEFLTVVECRRYAANRPIGPDMVQRLLWVADRSDRASHALIATTSRFTAGAQTLAREYEWRLSLRDIEGITEWLMRYGTWTKAGRQGVWLPASPSPRPDRGGPTPRSTGLPTPAVPLPHG